MVPISTGKMGEHFPVREFGTYWKSRGILHKILEESGNFRQFLFFSVIFIFQFSGPPGMSVSPEWLSNLGKLVCHSLYLWSLYYLDWMAMAGPYLGGRGAQGLDLFPIDQKVPDREEIEWQAHILCEHLVAWG